MSRIYLRFVPFVLIAAALMCWKFSGSTLIAADQTPPTLANMQKHFRDGNFKEAFDAAKIVMLDKDQDPVEVAQALSLPIDALHRLNRPNDTAPFLEQVVEAHADNWQVLHAAAKQYQRLNHYGSIIDNEFVRGVYRNGQVTSYDRDRVRMLQLYQQAIAIAKEQPAKPEMADLYHDLAKTLLQFHRGNAATELQFLTDLSTLPDYQQQQGHYGGYGHGAPVDEEGNPIFFTSPESWETAENDGQRMRWAMQQVEKYRPSSKWQVQMEWANFLQSQFGVQTLQQFSWFRGFRSDAEDATTHVYSLSTLKENETIARLATGIKRFELPDEFNHVRIFQQVIAANAANRASAYDQLARVFENRQQYPKAAETWRNAIANLGQRNSKYRSDRLNQIVGNFGKFEPTDIDPRGHSVQINYVFRNATNVSLTAQKIDVAKLLADAKAYLKSGPSRFQYQYINIQDVGNRILYQPGGEKYIGQQVAAWDVELEPRPNHFDHRIEIQAPVQNAGAYLVTAKLKDGNTSKIVVWVADTVIMHKRLDRQQWYMVADAVTGEPIPNANVELFGYRIERMGQRNQYRVETKSLSKLTDASGQLVLEETEVPTNFQWLVTATAPGDRLAYMGFQGIWYGSKHDATYHQVRSFGITDRPVYRPGQKVEFKFWTRESKYDKEDGSRFAGGQIAVKMGGPQGEEVFERNLEADAYGGVEGVWEIPSDAKLGTYWINASPGNGGIQFRVEEYKKPEYEVIVSAPDEPVALGEKIQGKITAKYYFGSPVTNATVTYKIMRTSYDQNWFPVAPWDWCFGPGYWWYAYDYNWYPGYHRWVGCMRPYPFWYPQRSDPPELVAERTAEIGEDGEIEFEIDTTLAKLMHGDQDHKYTITAEVRDQSRRTIVGTGDVLVSREPFKVYTWVDRGYYEVGQSIHANFQAQRLDGKDVKGRGELKLLKITYDQDRNPIETPIQSWDLTLDSGTTQQAMKATEAGQYRLSLSVTDQAGHKQEGGYIFTVRGADFDGSEFRFNDLELIPDKQQYQAGDTIKLQVNTNRVGSTVLLFVRPTNGVYLAPKMVRLEGKSTIHEIAVVKKDMPNFFVEALTVSDAKVHTDTKQIIVPPEERLLKMEVTTDQTEYLPGKDSTVTVKLTDETGEPFVGSTVLAVYDKAVEYISGGSNVDDIRKFFWDWKRSHHPQTLHSLTHHSYNMHPRGETTHQPLGAFGNMVADLDGLSDVSGNRGNDRLEKQSMRRSGAMPMPAAAPLALEAEAAFGDAGGVGGSAQAEPAMVEPTVRSNFADTALWRGHVETNAKGEAELTFTLPENLSTWKIRSWAMGQGTRVGQAESEIITRKNLIVRLQAPRFFLETDEVVLSAIVHNYLDTEKSAKVRLEVPSDLFAFSGDFEQTVRISAGGEHRVDWRVKVTGEGTADIRMFALTDEESDAVEQTFPVYVHGMLKTEAWAGTIQEGSPSGMITVQIPEKRRAEDSRLVVRYSPSLAASMVDALPYLIEYPHGCTEQTLNRFLPAVITRKVLEEMDLNLEAIAQHQNNLNAQELGDPAERKQAWDPDHPGVKPNPVFDDTKLAQIVAAGVKRLGDMQNSDGGWGWFSGFGEHSYPHTTAVVLRGLMIARENGTEVPEAMIQSGRKWLISYQAAELKKLQNADGRIKPWKNQADQIDTLVYAVLIEADHDNPAMREFIYRDRTKMSVYANAMFALAMHQVGDQEKLKMLRRNLDQYLVIDLENETAFLNLPENNYWWYWYGDSIEANAYYLKLLAASDKENPNAARMVKYLLNNRKHATYWKSTRDTALCVEAMADYLRASDELNPNQTVEIFIDGEKKGETEFNRENLFTADNTFEWIGEEVTSGEHQIELKRKGAGAVYFNVYSTNFTQEDFITKAGLEVKVERRFYRLEKDEDATTRAAGARGQALQQRVEKYIRHPLENEAEIHSGDLVEIELILESKNDYEYLIFEDKKAAGFEPVDLRSGYNGNALGAYMELRDDRVNFFVRRLPRGKYSLAYRVRAEVPGKFSALPTVGQAMYAPELKGNSDEMKIEIVDID